MRFSLRRKLIFVNLALLLIVTLSASTISTYELNKYYKSRIEVELNTQLNQVEFFLNALHIDSLRARKDYHTLTQYARAAELRITLIDKDGWVLFDSKVPQDSLPGVENHINRPELQLAREESHGYDDRHSVTTNVQMFYAAKEFIATNEKFANVEYLRLALPLVEIEQVLADIRRKILLGGTGAFILIAAVSFWISTKMTDPIQSLMQVAEQVKRGKLEAHFERQSEDEIGELADLLNEMVLKLREDVDQLQKLQQMRSQFLGNVSHELRTPIFSLQGYLETILDAGNMTPEKMREFIKKAYHNSKRLNALLTDLIDISRIESGEMKLNYRPFKLKTWLEKQIELNRPDAEEKGISLSLATPEKMDPALTINGDEDRLNQVLTNLIQNAIKYNIAGKQVVVRVREFENQVTVLVSDNGRGISAEHLPRLFERFYRVDKERSRTVGGTGLGLAIVKHIIEAHGGRVGVDSRIGAGSTFFFTLNEAKVATIIEPD